MQNDLAARIFQLYERGAISRRQAINRLVGLGAAMATLQTSGSAAEEDANRAQRATFQATGLDHIALDVTNVSRSRDFYIEHLGLKVIRQQGERMCFLGPDRGQFILALFHADKARLNHYCYAIKTYDADQVIAKLKQVGIEPRREANRVYFPDPDGITVQLAADE